MRPVIFILLVCCLACSPTKQSPEDIKAEIERILKVQEDAYDSNSPDRMKIIAATCEDSVIFVGGEDGGMHISVNGYVHDLADGYTDPPHHRYFRIYDNTVIVSHLQQAYKLFGNDTLYLNSRSTKVFVRNGNSWKMAYVTNAPVPIPYIEADYSNVQQFIDYAGIYDNRSPVPDTVFCNNGMIFFGSNSMPMMPIDDSTFLGTGYVGKTIFGRDEKGKVTHYTFEWPDGQRMQFSKLK